MHIRAGCIWIWFHSIMIVECIVHWNIFVLFVQFYFALPTFGHKHASYISIGSHAVFFPRIKCDKLLQIASIQFWNLIYIS